jgi:hypothetical protein
MLPCTDASSLCVCMVHHRRDRRLWDRLALGKNASTVLNFYHDTQKV